MLLSGPVNIIKRGGIGFSGMVKKLNHVQIGLLVLILIATFLLVYSPHFNYAYPLHIDEWRHISEARKINEGIYPEGFEALEIGFQLFLSGLYKVVDVVLIYKFLPALFASIAGLMVFFFVYNLTQKYLPSLFSLIFFASLKSNVNIMGLWFFSPLTFAIPLIYLFFWLFSSGVENDTPKKLLYSGGVYILLIFTHPISATFMIPIIIMYSFIKYKFFIKHWKICTLWLITPLLGLLFYTYTFKQNFITIFNALIFQKGWGVLELDIPLTWGYSIVGALLAVIGAWYAYKHKHYIFIIWSLLTLMLVMLYKHLEFSIFAPHQRMFYYFLISLPILSGFGLYYVFTKVKLLIKKRHYLVFLTIMFLLIILFSFRGYNNIDRQVDLYTVIDDHEYQALKFLEHYDNSDTRVMAMPKISTAIYSISGHKVVGSYYFHGNRKDAEKFFQIDCDEKTKLIKKHNVKYVLSTFPIDCGWGLIYNENNFIYKV